MKFKYQEDEDDWDEDTEEDIEEDIEEDTEDSEEWIDPRHYIFLPIFTSIESFCSHYIPTYRNQ